MTLRDIGRRAAARLALALAARSLLTAEVTSGPAPALAPGEDRRAVGSTTPSTVYREADGTPYVLRGPNEKQFLGGYDVTLSTRITSSGRPASAGSIERQSAATPSSAIIVARSALPRLNRTASSARIRFSAR